MRDLHIQCQIEAFEEDARGWGGDPGLEYVPLVLVVQQGPELGDMVAEELAEYQVLLEADGERALEAALRETPDAILLGDDLAHDLVWELCRTFRGQEGLKRVPIVVISPQQDEEIMRRAIEVGADDLLFRPFGGTELAIRVRNMVRSRLYLHQVEEKNAILNSALADLKESEAMLVQAEKLSQLGEMSAGIVHEINNPLNYSHTAVFMLKQMIGELEGEQRADFEDVLADIREGLDRVSHIVRDLRAFASRSRAVTAKLNLAAVVQTAARLLGHKLSNISFVSTIPEEIWIRGDENQLCQVILNLIKNGVEATEAAQRSLEEAQIMVVAEEAGEKVELKIRDNGCGISEEEKEKVFAPFFTKKGKGKGMGLGLSICRRIVEEHDGSITIKSKEGHYTEFILVFPLGEPPGIRAA